MIKISIQGYELTVQTFGYALTIYQYLDKNLKFNSEKYITYTRSS